MATTGILLGQYNNYATKADVEKIAQDTLENINYPILNPPVAFTYDLIRDKNQNAIDISTADNCKVTPYNYWAYMDDTGQSSLIEMPEIIITCNKSGFYNCLIELEGRTNRVSAGCKWEIETPFFTTTPISGQTLGQLGVPGSYVDTIYPYQIHVNDNFAGGFCGLSFYQYFKKGSQIKIRTKAIDSITLGEKTYSCKDNQLIMGANSGSKSYYAYLTARAYLFSGTKNSIGEIIGQSSNFSINDYRASYQPS